MTLEHGPARIQVSDGKPQLIQCVCGAIGGLSSGWDVVQITPTHIELKPSILFRQGDLEHFHTGNPTGLIPIGDGIWPQRK